MAMDIVLQLITESQMYIADYEDMSMEQIMMESDKADMKERLSSNSDIANKSASAMKRALNKLREMISTISKSIIDFMDKMFMGEAEKKQLEKYNEMIKNTPGMENKKVSVRDFRKLNSAYDDAIRAADEAARKDMEPSFGEKIMDKLNKILPAAVITVGMMSALSIAKKNKNVADVINKQLKREDGIAADMERVIGKDATSDFKKDMKKTANKAWWTRFRVSLLGKKARDNKLGHTSLLSTLAGVIGNDPIAKAKAMNAAGEMIQDPKKAKQLGKGLKVAGTAMEIKSNIDKTFNSMKKNKK